MLESSLLSITGATAAAPDTIVDPGAALHFKALHQAEVSTRGRDRPTHVQLEQIDRRRSKPSLSEAEFGVGMTERLLPELPRLPALHEVHYGDAVVRELDRSTYFALKQGNSTSATTLSMNAGASHPSTDSAAAPGNAAVVIINGEACVEMSLDEDLGEASFSAFDAEAGKAAPTASHATTPARTGAAAASVPASSTAEGQIKSAKGDSGREKCDAAAGGALCIQEDIDASDAAEPGNSNGDDSDAEEDGLSLQLNFGAERPWFVPASGVVQLHPLSPQDCALLLRFVLRLRQQSEVDLVPSLRRALIAAEQQTAETEAGGEGHAKRGGASVMSEPPQASLSSEPATSSRGRRPHLTLADVVRYLDTAPPPVIAFTESLPANSASPCTSSSGPDSTSPAFVFHMYLENISSQNALGHLAGLFGIPQRSFQTHTAASKMSCSTVMCAIAENRVRREHLLLLNTLRHPGFVLRVSDIREVREDVHGSSGDSAGADASSPSSTSQRLFRELARWQPLYHTEVLLRRVCSAGSTASGSGLSTRQQLEHRLRAVQTVGAICFCANREASLARAATDVLHNFFRSALLNALQRRKAPVPLTRFLKRPNLATAQHAHHVSTDVTVRQVLKTFIQCNGDWHATVVRTPYVWRRRWINALRGLVWNTMASQRIRKAGREVCLGDVVLKPEYRDDVHRRGIMTVKAEHVMVVTTSAEAQAACMEDVFIPFLRGRYPEHLFADESTGHPIMTRTNMLALLRAMHAPQLLLGFTDEARLLLDIRADVSPLLFRRLLVRPLGLEFAILEDKPPMRALHFDAARLLTNDRWLAADGVKQQQQEQEQHPSSRTGLNDNNGNSGNAPRPTALQLACASHLIPPSVVLERTTLGARLASGILSEEFFSVPSADDYVVLGHAHRHLDGDLVQAAPHSDTAVVGDRVYSVYIRAVVEHNLAGLSSMLREYFALSGIETEADSSLQHKVHRMRRELDPETELLTAPVYCSTCYNRDHDTQEQCAEYQYKRHRRGAQLDLAAAALQLEEDAHRKGMEHERGAALPPVGMPGKRHGDLGRDEASVTDLTPSMPPAASTAATTPVPARTVCMRWRLRRRHDEQRWGVRFTKSLHLVGIDDASLLREAAVWCSATSEACDAVSSASTTAVAMPDEAEVCPWPSFWIAQSAPVDEQAPPSSSSALRILQFVRAALRGSVGTDTGTAPQQLVALTELLAQSPLLRLPPAALTVALPPSTAAPAASLLKACKWRLAKVNAKPVATQRDVAAALLTEAVKSREVWLTFEVPIGAAAENSRADVLTRAPPGASDSTGALTKRDDAGSTASRGVVPQSTAAMPPKRRHEAEVAMRRALSEVSPDTRRWVQDLPYRVTVVLKKHRRQVQAHRSWGLQLDGTDMTLVNFAQLMLRFMADSDTHDKQGHGGGRCSVASIAPGEAFPRLISSSSSDKNDRHLHSVSKLLSDLDPGLMPVLNDMYRVMRIHNTPVRHKAEAARAMADFQASLDAALASAHVAEPSAPPRGGDHRGAHANMSASSEEFFLTLTLERKASSYRLCSSPATEHGLQPAAAELSGRSNAPVSANASSSAAALSPPGATAVVDAALLSGLATERCPVRPITEAQLSRSVVTVAINRLLLTSATMDKWGLRLQQGTRRLKAIQENQYFSFHVFAAKKSQGARIADTLRLIPASNAAMGAATRSNASTSATRRAHHLYYVERVNRTAVRSHAELRQALLTAAQPAQQQQQLGRGPTPMPALPPESVTLGVRQLPLLRLSATVRRGGVGEESALGPVGLQVDNHMQVVAVFAGSPMARALDEAAGPICSLRRLIRDRSDASGALDSTPEVGSEAAWDVVRDPQLRESLARVAAATSVPSSSSAGGSAGGGTDETRTARMITTVAKKPVRRQWNYGMDEDDGENSSGGNDTPDTRVAAVATGTSPGAPAAQVSAPSLLLVEEESAVRTSLRDLAAVAAYIQQQLCKCTMVDGVHVLQASMLQEFALAQLAKLDQRHGPTSDGAPSSEDAVEAAAMLAGVRTELAQLHKRVDAVHHEVRWEVVYAVASNRPLRTPADLAAAFAPGVAEETIILQQLMED
ncbi:conserved hypothetical protein [Leishmania major strain Friedlin]|uniref:Uncharacterized protein n=1 Tax=Leishmania major TaxID=5664 RepID=E9ACJ8_LEIMA|nr:conserved hypothetical protein [Leishmania major strain Friedlin]CAG9567279.1 hypothetical_protein_-_conserved [Leishmania major strain Friedlin]CBZ12015.1 conserved hypothetical protein [Leishmania major strain Friedlin]|eukprot:XP_003721729.1 conserved hypothetical protein [Leishmania major strain Friedlin]